MDMLDISQLIAQIEQGRNVPEPKILEKTPLTQFIDKPSASSTFCSPQDGQQPQQQSPKDRQGGQQQNPGDTPMTASLANSPNSNTPTSVLGQQKSPVWTTQHSQPQ
jgi:hypothetical protein